MAKTKQNSPQSSKQNTRPPTLLHHLRTRLSQIIGFIALSILFMVLPGQNEFQILTLHPQATKAQPLNITLPPLPDYPVPLPTIQPPTLTAQGVYVLDVDSGAILYKKNADLQLLPASTTKIMTALIALETYSLDDIVTIRNEDRSIGHTAELVAGEQLTVEDVLYALLVSSGNDAALALAQRYPGGYIAFVDSMNAKAKQLHLDNTHYSNVSGVEQPHHYTTTRDLALLTKEAMKNETFRQIVSTQSTTITSLDGQTTHYLTNINQLLGVVEGLQGVKTGWTDNAGECLVTSTVRDNHQIITVILNSQDRFGESAYLINWAYQNHQWKQPLSVE